MSFHSRTRRRKRSGKIKKCKKRTRLFALIRWEAEINRRPNRIYVWFYQGYEVVLCCVYHVFWSAGSNKRLKKIKKKKTFTCKMTVNGSLPLPIGLRRTVSVLDCGALHGANWATVMRSHAGLAEEICPGR